jgi:hypothetical protein
MRVTAVAHLSRYRGALSGSSILVAPGHILAGSFVDLGKDCMTKG